MKHPAIARLRHDWPVALLVTAMAAGLAAPLVSGAATTGFFVEVLLGGLMTGCCIRWSLSASC